MRWRKVRGDLGQYRARTTLVVASIAIGVFAVGTTAGHRSVYLAYLIPAAGTLPIWWLVNPGGPAPGWIG